MRGAALVLRSVAGLVLLGACGHSNDVTGASAPPDAAPSPTGPGSPAGDAGDATDATDAGDAPGEPSDSGSACPPAVSSSDSAAPVPTAGMSNLVPLPVSVAPAGGTFVLASTATIRIDPATAEMTSIGEYLGARLRRATGYALPVLPASGSTPCAGDVILTTVGGDPTLASEGYDLVIDAAQVRLSAFAHAGIFRGLQTLRQLLPAAIEANAVSAGPWPIATGTIHDYPRFAWRGTMLDVARHFFGVADVETYIDLLAYYKVNIFHLHLSDDQGWRIVIDAWPNLATYGGSTEIGGGAGGYYSQAEYAEIVRYAQDRYITVVPEIDMPGHTNAALASYGSLTCSGTAPPLDTAPGVSPSSLCVNGSATHTFAADVIREVAGLSPGPYFHVGGDEAVATSASDFQTFFAHIEPLLQTAGKQMVGWDATGQLTSLLPGTIVQYWASADAPFVTSAVGQSAKVLMSPAGYAYMDMKYDPATTLGQSWAGYIDEEKGYAWDPATMIGGVTDAQIVGLEAPLWTETLVSLADVEYMAFPRIAGYAEIGWSPSTGRAWSEYKTRIGAHGPRLRALGVTFHTSAIIPWQ